MMKKLPLFLLVFGVVFAQQQFDFSIKNLKQAREQIFGKRQTRKGLYNKSFGPQLSEPKWWHVLDRSDEDTLFWNNVETEKIVVNLHTGKSLQDIQNFIKEAGLGEIVNKSIEGGSLNFYVFSAPGFKPQDVRRIARLAKEKYSHVIKGVEPLPIYRFFSGCHPVDPVWWDNNTNQPRHTTAGWSYMIIGADSAWCYGKSGPYWTVVIDQALDYNHEDIAALYGGGYDFADSDANVYPSLASESHGTHVSGTVMAVHNNGVGLAGMVQDTLWFAKVANDGANGGIDIVATVNAVDYVTTNMASYVRTINMSLGGPSYWATFDQSVTNAWNAGIVLVAAAGNDGANAVSYPAAYSAVIAVGSIDMIYDATVSPPYSQIFRSSFSNYGPEIELAAPGGTFYYTSSGGTYGYQVYSSVPYNDQYAYMAGTSMASPHVAGLAQLLFAINPCLNNALVRQILQNTAVDLAPTGRDDSFGYGLIDAVAAVIEALPMRIDTVVKTDASCGGSCDGTITVSLDTLYDGLPPYTISWSDDPNANSLTRTGLCPGTYIVTITDQTGCSISDTIVILSGGPGSITITLDSLKNVSCNGGSDGAIYITASGGSAPYTYSWTGPSGFTASTEDITGLTAGTYIVSVTDANGCVSSDTFVVNEPSAISITGTVTDANCGNSNGAIDITVTGGTAPYTYSWSNGATTEDLSSIPPGTYSVTVTDANGCTTTASFTVNNISNLSVTGVVTDATCHGDSTGAIDITVSGGTPPYSYSWTNGATTQDLVNIPAGAYSVTVTDANGCVATASFIVNAPPPIVIAGNITQPTCGNSDGIIDITVSGGTAPYSYSWSNGATTQDLINVPSGTYIVTITDANGCTKQDTFLLTDQGAPTITGVVYDVTCGGASDGAIDVTITGGTTPYTISWSNGATTEDLVGISGGTYIITVTDANGCVATQSFTVNEPPAIIITGMVTDASCAGAPDGAIDITVTGGFPPYTYSWNGGIFTTEDLSGVGAGSYTVTVTDTAGCSQQATFTVGEPPAITVTVDSIVAATCNQPNGAIYITVSGGTPGYTFSWDIGFTTEDLVNVNGGTYTLTVMDAAGCSDTFQFTVPAYDTPYVTNYQVIDVTCHGASDGAIYVIGVSGGFPPYTYQWNTGATGPNIANLSGGVYTVLITDASGCQSVMTFTVEEPLPLIISTGAIPATPGNADGKAWVTYGGGTPPYSILWSTGATTDTIGGLSAGTYWVLVRDSVGCSAKDTVVVPVAQGVITTDAGLCDLTHWGGVECQASINTVSVIDMTGKTIYNESGEGTRTQPFIPVLPIGKYVISIETSQGLWRKVIGVIK
ncbi:MAG: S8 family serine peptidase [Chlorobi bacterium]|nr:S8 family serine peptidase [Chlorobiota bacterium]